MDFLKTFITHISNRTEEKVMVTFQLDKLKNTIFTSSSSITFATYTKNTDKPHKPKKFGSCTFQEKSTAFLPKMQISPAPPTLKRLCWTTISTQSLSILLVTPWTPIPLVTEMGVPPNDRIKSHFHVSGSWFWPCPFKVNTDRHGCDWDWAMDFTTCFNGMLRENLVALPHFKYTFLCRM